MGTPFLSEMRIMSFNFAPKGWAQCNGQFLPINQNQALFSLLGTMYGGNGQTTFALPDMRGKAPISMGAGFTEGQVGGQESHTITMSEMPAHNHFLQANLLPNPADSAIPSPNLLGTLTTPIYGPLNAATTLAPASVTNVGGSQPHQNMQPYIVLNFCIALQGAFPSQN
ncbi:MAG: phage tail protein [Acidobacteria bacterium]|nr:phage tail protein [Acidobacteriota bacterium]MBV9184841.1 phage tail protein [Acidobacteriota bacterium]